MGSVVSGKITVSTVHCVYPLWQPTDNGSNPNVFGRVVLSVKN